MVNVVNPNPKKLSLSQAECLSDTICGSDLRYDIWTYMSSDLMKIILVSDLLHKAIEDQFGEFDENTNFIKSDIWSILSNSDTELACYDEEVTNDNEVDFEDDEAYDNRVRIEDLTTKCEALMIYEERGIYKKFCAFRISNGVYVKHEKYPQPFSGKFEKISRTVESEYEAFAEVFVDGFSLDAPEADRLRILERLNPNF
jgi:hypothetical protein